MRNYLPKAFVLLIGLLLHFPAVAQGVDELRFEKRYTFYFKVNSDKIEADYMGNAETIERLRHELGTYLERPEAIDSLVLFSSSSPEGSLDVNKNLSRARSKMTTNLVEELFPNVDRSRVTVHSHVDEDWSGLLMLVQNDTELYGREQILEIFRTVEDSEVRKAKLKALEGGKVYSNLIKKHYDDLRYCIVEVRIALAMPKAIEVADKVALTAPVPAPKVEWSDEVVYVPSFNKHLTLKTNVLGWALTGSNIAVEVDLAEHFSISVPFYYSGGLDYFKETIKFRGIVLQPEFRYYPWLTDDKSNGGFFAGAHFGLGWYNFALNGDYRIQDHKGNRPAIGGGLGLGYTLKFKKHPRWGMEFTLGAGVYDVKYDTFYNENNGPYDEKGVRDVWFGIDNAAVSFTYNFDLKKGGKK